MEKVYKKIKFICILVGFPYLLSAKELPKQFGILPQPQKIEITGEDLFYGSELSFIIAEGNPEIPVLKGLINELPRYRNGSKGITLQLSEAGTPESPEGYILEVNRKGVVISARSQAGLFYGCQTLEQLMEDSRDFQLKLPEMKITDYPDIAFRAIHLDTKHHLDRMEYYYAMIDKLSSYKINALIWEIEDKLRYTRRPEVGAPNAISKQEMQALCRYANERNIEINPLVQGLGHAGFILKHHWELRENPDSDWEFCPADSRTYDLQFDLYKDAMEAMPYCKYLHIGGDEITAIGIDDRCKATGKSAFELQMIWLKRVCDFAVANGKTPIFWDDMPLKHGGLWHLLHGGYPDDEIRKRWNTEELDKAIALFPKECIYMRWHYDDPTILPHRLILDWYRKSGLKVMGATAASYGESPFMPRHHSKALDIKNFCTLAVQNGLEGILSTAWDDGSPHLETVMRGFIAQGEYGWNPQGRTVEEFIAAHAQREFGLGAENMIFLKELEESAFFFDRALVTSGRRNPAWQVTKDFTLVALPEKSEPGEWSKAYRGRLDTAKIENKRYELICQGIQIAKQQSKRNRYTLTVYEQTNHLFNYPVRLLLALETYDNAKSDHERKSALEAIKEVCDSFVLMRAKLEEVYSQTRFMQNPEGYISDHNHHNHLAALTNNSDWMYLYELPMIRKIREWVEKQ
jgi:hypothetical protein